MSMYIPQTNPNSPSYPLRTWEDHTTVKDKSHAIFGTFGNFLANLASRSQAIAMERGYKSRWTCKCKEYRHIKIDRYKLGRTSMQQIAMNSDSMAHFARSPTKALIPFRFARAAFPSGRRRACSPIHRDPAKHFYGVSGRAWYYLGPVMSAYGLNRPQGS